jgi:hypothetical protein
MPSGIAGGYQRLEGTHRLSFHSTLKTKAVCSSEMLVNTYKATGVTAQNTTFYIFTALRTSKVDC